LISPICVENDTEFDRVKEAGQPADPLDERQRASIRLSIDDLVSRNTDRLPQHLDGRSAIVLDLG